MDWPLVLGRWLALAGLLGTAGCAVFRLAVLGASASAGARYLLWVARIGAVVGLLGLADWTARVTAALAAPEGIAAWWSGLGAVLGDTTFGHLVLAQAALLLAAAVVLGRQPGRARWALAAALALAATMLHVGHGHAWAMADGLSLPVISEVLHLSAAAVWLGGLPPLLLLTVLAPSVAAGAAARFSPIGFACVLVLAATALLQGSVLVGSLGALTGTAYGRVALLKMGLFAVLVGFALLNRYQLVPALAAGAGIRGLRASLALETAVGVLVVLAAALLSQLQPGMSMPGM